MIGGTVIGLSMIGDVVLLNVQDNTYGDECAVRCVQKRADTGEAVRIMPGDQVWWQSGKVYWTPKRHKNTGVCRYSAHDAITHGDDIPLTKLGYSHSTEVGMLNDFQWYRRWRGGRWGVVTGWFWGKRWIRVTDACLEDCQEDWRR